MPPKYRPNVPEQHLLLPPSLSDWLPEGHLAHFISDIIDTCDMTLFHERYRGDQRRNRPFDPLMMVKVIVYCYVSGTFSSRRIAKRIQEDVAVRFLAAGNVPTHRTISDFRVQHLEAFTELLTQVIRLGREAGLIKVERVAVDGSKVRANASKHKAMSYDRMKEDEQRLEKEIQEMVKRAEAEDAAEDAEYGPDKAGTEVAEELQLRESRLKKIKEAKARLEQRQREEDAAAGRSEGDHQRKVSPFKREFGVPPEKAQENFTDTDSRIMKSTEGFQQCYNTQIAVDAPSQMIVAATVTRSGADQEQLLGVIDLVQGNCSVTPGCAIADAGYRSECAFVSLEDRGVDAYVAVGREGKVVKRVIRGEATLRMKEKLATAAGDAIYRRRKAIVEPVFGWIKHVIGFRRFSLRGLGKVQGEWAIVCLAINIKRMKVLQTAG